MLRPFLFSFQEGQQLIKGSLASRNIQRITAIGARSIGLVEMLYLLLECTDSFSFLIFTFHRFQECNRERTWLLSSGFSKNKTGIGSGTEAVLLTTGSHLYRRFGERSNGAIGQFFIARQIRHQLISVEADVAIEQAGGKAGFANMGRTTVFLTTIEIIHCREIVVLDHHLVYRNRVR